MGPKEMLTGMDSSTQQAETTAEPNSLDRLRGNVAALVLTVIAGGAATSGCLSEQEQRNIETERCQRETDLEFGSVSNRCGRDTFTLRNTRHCEMKLVKEGGVTHVRGRLEKICGGELSERQGAQVDFLQKDYRVAKMIICGGEGGPKDCKDKANEKRARLDSLIEELSKYDIINSNERLEEVLSLIDKAIILAYELNIREMADRLIVRKNKLESGQVKDIMKLMTGVKFSM